MIDLSKTNSEYNKKYYDKHKAEILKQQKLWKSKNMDKVRKYWLDWKRRNPKKFKEYQKQRHVIGRIEVLTYYSKGIPKCSCCGIKELVFLTIDHIKGGGKKHRKFVRGYSFYRWLIRNNFPKGLRVLCWNCNWANHVMSKCPHKK